MGVDFFPCDRCNATICDCGDYERCDCGRVWCCINCARADGWRPTYDDDGEHVEGLESCSYCRGEEATDEVLLYFALNKLEMSRDDLLAEWIAVEQEEQMQESLNEYAFEEFYIDNTDEEETEN